MTQTFHDKITKLCLNHFSNLPKTGKPTTNEWTVLSCIVKQNTITDHFEVVSLGTGSKCIGKSKMSLNGDILNDSHAEVICRRAFLRYIYNEIMSNSSEIFTFDCNLSTYCLKDSIVFHFFTSHVPCGDAAIFPKQDLSEFGDLLEQANFNSCKTESLNQLKRSAECDINMKVKKAKLACDLEPPDIYRTGAKCLPDKTKQDLHLSGFGYHTVGAVRTKPGRGDPTLTMSCSDKITKWCFLGIQGALLSVLIKEPIYLSSFTIAGQTQYCDEALRRALFERCGSVQLRSPYQLKKMVFGQASLGFEFSKSDLKQPCPCSIAWCKVNSRCLEVAVEGKKQGVTKKNRNTKAGRLQISKVELFRTFLNIIKRLQPNFFGNVELEQVCYNIAKTSAKEYQEMWKVLKRTGFKVWTVKDCALLRFSVD